MKWERGAATIAQLLSDGRLELVTGAVADGTELQAPAEALLRSARRLDGS